MKKIWILFVLASLICPWTNSVEAKWFKKKQKTQTKKEIVTYTVASAKEESFKDLAYTLPASQYKSDLKDPYFASNFNYINKGKEIGKREPKRAIMPSYCGNILISYAIRYDDKLEKVYFYNSTGKLMRIEYDNNNPDKYPKRMYSYNNKGILNSVVFFVSQTNQYNFDGKGNLIVHWIGETGYGRDGKPMRIKRSL